jgi:hypothetical protein
MRVILPEVYHQPWLSGVAGKEVLTEAYHREFIDDEIQWGPGHAPVSALERPLPLFGTWRCFKPQ